MHLYGAELYRYARRCTGESNAAEDIVQDTFCAAWRSIHTLRDPEKSRAWLFQILRHRYSRWLQQQKQHISPTASSSRANVLQFSHYDPRPQLEGNDLLQVGLNALKQRYKEPFLMVFLLGMTCEETAKTLDIPVGTVLSRIHRAKQRLRAYLEEQEHTDTLPLPSNALFTTDEKTSPSRRNDKKAGR